MITYEGFAQQGWQCPVCGRVMAPSAMWCFWCAEKSTTTATNITISADGTCIRDIRVNPGKAKEDEHG